MSDTGCQAETAGGVCGLRADATRHHGQSRDAWGHPYVAPVVVTRQRVTITIAVNASGPMLVLSRVHAALAPITIDGLMWVDMRVEMGDDPPLRKVQLERGSDHGNSNRDERPAA